MKPKLGLKSPFRYRRAREESLANEALAAARQLALESKSSVLLDQAARIRRLEARISALSVERAVARGRYLVLEDAIREYLNHPTREKGYAEARKALVKVLQWD